MGNAFLALHLSILLAGWTGVWQTDSAHPRHDRLLACCHRRRHHVCVVNMSHTFERCSPKERVQYLLLGAFLAYQWMLFYAGIKASNISIGVVSFSTLGFFTAIFEPLLNKKRIALHEIGFSLLTVPYRLIFHFDSRYRLGIIFGTLSAAGAALIAIYMKAFAAAITHKPY